MTTLLELKPNSLTKFPQSKLQTGLQSGKTPLKPAKNLRNRGHGAEPELTLGE